MQNEEENLDGDALKKAGIGFVDVPNHLLQQQGLSELSVLSGFNDEDISSPLPPPPVAEPDIQPTRPNLPNVAPHGVATRNSRRKRRGTDQPGHAAQNSHPPPNSYHPFQKKNYQRHPFFRQKYQNKSHFTPNNYGSSSDGLEGFHQYRQRRRENLAATTGLQGNYNAATSASRRYASEPWSPVQAAAEENAAVPSRRAHSSAAQSRLQSKANTDAPATISAPTPSRSRLHHHELGEPDSGGERDDGTEEPILLTAAPKFSKGDMKKSSSASSFSSLPSELRKDPPELQLQSSDYSTNNKSASNLIKSEQNETGQMKPDPIKAQQIKTDYIKAEHIKVVNLDAFQIAEQNKKKQEDSNVRFHVSDPPCDRLENEAIDYGSSPSLQQNEAALGRKMNMTHVHHAAPQINDLPQVEAFPVESDENQNRDSFIYLGESQVQLVDDHESEKVSPCTSRVANCIKKVLYWAVAVPFFIVPFVILVLLWEFFLFLLKGMKKFLFNSEVKEENSLSGLADHVDSWDGGRDHILHDRELLWTLDEWQTSHRNLYQAELEAEQDRLQYSGLHKLCNAPLEGPNDERWDHVRDYLEDLQRKDPSQVESELQVTQRPGLQYNPLHVVCMLSPPIDVVEDMINLCPRMLDMKSMRGDSPLALATGGFFPASLQVIEMLVNVSPCDLDHVNSCLRTPLHNYLEACEYYAVDPCPDVVKLLVTEKASNSKDYMGQSTLWKIGRVATKLSTTSANFKWDHLCKSLEYILSERGKHYDSSCFMEDIRHLPSELRLFTFENEVVKRLLNEAMSRAPYAAVLMMDFFVQCTIVASFTNEIVSGGSNSAAATAFLLLGMFYWVLRRSLSFASTSNKGKFISDPWKLLDLAHCILLLISTIYLHRKDINTDYSDAWRNVLIATSCFTWLVMISILRASSKDFAVFVDTAIEITLRLISFILASFIVLAAFATMFYISVKNTAYCSEICTSLDGSTPECHTDESLHFCTLPDALLRVYAFFVGGLEESSFTEIPPSTVILTGIFAFIVTILLLNIIIAIVTDAYASVNKKAEVVFWAHRFDYLHEVNRFINIVSSKYSYGIFDFQDLNDGIKSRDNDKPWTWKKIEMDPVGWEGKKSKLFKSLVRKSRSITNLHSLLVSVMALFSLVCWFVVGLLTLGILWPRIVRKAIFCPRVPRNRTSTLVAGSSRATEVQKLVEKCELLEKSLLSMSNMIQDLAAFIMEKPDQPTQRDLVALSAIDQGDESSREDEPASRTSSRGDWNTVGSRTSGPAFAARGNEKMSTRSSSSNENGDVEKWLLSHLPRLKKIDIEYYSECFVSDGFDSLDMLDELFEEDLHFMRKAHRRALAKKLFGTRAERDGGRNEVNGNDRLKTPYPDPD